MNPNQMQSTPNFSGSGAALATTEPALTIVEILFKRKATVLVFVMLALGLGAAYQYYMPPEYQGKAEVYIEKSSEGGKASPLSPKGVSAGDPTTHAALLTSTPVLQAALADPTVAGNLTFADSSDPVSKLRKGLNVLASEDGETMSITLKSNHQDEIAPLINAVLRAYLYAQQLNTSADHFDQEVAPQVTAQASMMTDQMLAARLMSISEQLTQAQIQAEAAKMRLQHAQQSSDDIARLAELAKKAGIDLNTMGLSELGYLTSELSRLKQVLSGMPEVWGPEHHVRAPIERQAQRIQEDVGYLRVQASKRLLLAITNEQDRAVQKSDQLAEALAKEQDVAVVTAQLPVRVIEPAQFPIKPHGPKAAKTMAVAMLFGLSLGMLMALHREMKAHDYTAFQAPRPTGNTAPAASEPGLIVSEKAPLALPAPAPAPESLNVPMLGSVPLIPSSHRLTSPNFDASASAIHQIRAVLQVQASKNGKMAYAFTSPRRGAGKTSVTIGVATSLAMSGTRTLVVDCDLAGRISKGQTGQPASNNPTADQNDFGPIDPNGSSPENGSIDKIALEQGYLNETETKAVGSPVEGERIGVTGMLDGSSLESCIVPATVDGLSLLPAVAAETRHIALMSDRFVRRLLDEAKEHFDVVLFDTGPIPGSVEALLVTSQVDGVVLVLPEGESQANIQKTVNYLKVIDATIAGTVNNGAAAQTASPEAREVHRDFTASNGSDDQDFEDMDSGNAVGSGIMAAALFSDVDSGYANDQWELQATSDQEFEPKNPSVFNGSVDELFATATTQADETKDDA